MTYNNKRGSYYPSRYYSGANGGNSNLSGNNTGGNSDSQPGSGSGGGRRENGGLNDKYNGDYSHSYKNYYDSYRGSGSNSNLNSNPSSSSSSGSNSKYHRKYNKYNHQNNSYSGSNKPSINRSNLYYNNPNGPRRKDRYDSYTGKAFESHEKRNYDKYEEYMNSTNEKKKPGFESGNKDLQDSNHVDEMRLSVSSTGFRDERRGNSVMSSLSRDNKEERENQGSQQHKIDEKSQPFKNDIKKIPTNFHDSRASFDYHDHERSSSFDLRDDNFRSQMKIEEEEDSNRDKLRLKQCHDDVQTNTQNVRKPEANILQDQDEQLMIDKELELLAAEKKRKEEAKIQEQKQKSSSDNNKFGPNNESKTSSKADDNDKSNAKLDSEIGWKKSNKLILGLAASRSGNDRNNTDENVQLKSGQSPISHSRSQSRSRSNSSSKPQSKSRSRSNSNSISKDDSRPKVKDIFNNDQEVISSSRKTSTDALIKQESTQKEKIESLKKSGELNSTVLSTDDTSKLKSEISGSDISGKDHKQDNKEIPSLSFERSTPPAPSDNVSNPELNLVEIKKSEIDGSNPISAAESVPTEVEKKIVNTNETISSSVNDGGEENLSEAETVVANSPPRMNKIKRLVRKKDYDINRHKLKKRRIYSSEDEEDEEDELVEEQEGEGDIENQKDMEDVKEENSSLKPQVSRSPKKIKEKPYKMKRDSGGRSLLQRACKKGDIKLIQEYLSRGADANEKDFGGFTCLHEAALEGHADVVQLLISHGANVNAKADAVGDSETPLIDAAENKHYETVKVLLDNGADPTIYNIDGFTALTKIFNEHSDDDDYKDIIKLLEDALAKVQKTKASELTKVRSNSKSRAVSIVDDPTDTYFAELIKKKGIYKFAAEGSKELTANYFVSGNTLEAKPDVLILAARNGHVELVDIILGLNPSLYDLNTENSCGVTVLLASVGRGHYEVVESLLSKGADPLKKRYQDNLNSIEIAQGSIHYSEKEVELLQRYAAKQSTDSSNNAKSDLRASLNVQSEFEDHRDKKLNEENVERNDLLNNSDEDSMESKSKPAFIKKRKSSTGEQGVVKKTKILPSDPRPSKSQVGNFSNKRIEKIEVNERSRSSSPQSEKKSAIRHSASPSPSPQPGPQLPSQPAPLTKAQEEQKAKYAEEARVWQEKVEAKKRARREMFLKSEKEKERKRQEEEEKRVEEEKRLAEELEKEKSRILKEAQEKSKVLAKKRDELKYEFTKENYPIGLKNFKFDTLKTLADLRDYLPLYIFKINNIDYVLDLQISLITSLPIGKFGFDITNPIELSTNDKSKVWNLFYPMIGIDGKQPFKNMAKLYSDGHNKFQYLLLHFIRYDETTEWLSNQFPTYFKFITENRLHNQVSLESLQPLLKSQFKTIINDDVSDFVIDTKIIEKCKFIPPNLKRRKDSLRTIQNVSLPLW